MEWSGRRGCSTQPQEDAINVLKNLLEKRDALQAEIDGIVAGLTEDAESGESGESRERAPSAEEEQRSNEILAEIKDLDVRIKEEKRAAKTQKMLAEARSLVGTPAAPSERGVDAAVTDEPRVYGPGSPNSWYHDLISLDRRSVLDPVHAAAQQRMVEWSNQVEREIEQRSKIGKHAERQIREQYRDGGIDYRQVIKESRERARVAIEHKAETRAITTGGGATASAGGGGAAAFVTPIFTEPDYVPYREFGRAFADQCTPRPLPDYGLAIYKPQITGPAAVSSGYSEGSAVPETDPTMGYIAATLTTITGEVTVSQAVLDRTGPGFDFDQMVWEQLNIDYTPKFDTYVLTQALANATTQSWTGNSGAFVLTSASGAGGFYGQVSKAKAAMRKAVGTVLNPTHLFLDPARWEYIAAWSDSQGRPVVVPDYAGAFNAAAGGSADGDVGIEGRTGFRFNGLPVFTDANLPTVGTAALDQALVTDAKQVYVYEGAPVHRVLPQTLAGNLQVILQQYSYATALVNYQKSVTSVQGSGMAAISYTN